MDCVNCLIGFANNKTSHRISLKAIALLRICEDRLAEVHHKYLLLRILFFSGNSIIFLISCSCFMTHGNVSALSKLWILHN